jgi:hypothetical protein
MINVKIEHPKVPQIYYEKEFETPEEAVAFIKKSHRELLKIVKRKSRVPDNLRAVA